MEEIKSFSVIDIDGYKIVENLISGESDIYYQTKDWFCCVQIHDVISIPQEYWTSSDTVTIKENGNDSPPMQPHEVVDYFSFWRGISFMMPIAQPNENHTSIENWVLLEKNKEQDETVVNMSVLFKYITDNVLDADAMLNDQAVIDAFASIPSPDDPVADDSVPNIVLNTQPYNYLYPFNGVFRKSLFCMPSAGYGVFGTTLVETASYEDKTLTFQGSRYLKTTVVIPCYQPNKQHTDTTVSFKVDWGGADITYKDIKVGIIDNAGYYSNDAKPTTTTINSGSTVELSFNTDMIGDIVFDNFYYIAITLPAIEAEFKITDMYAWDGTGEMPNIVDTGFNEFSAWKNAMINTKHHSFLKHDMEQQTLLGKNPFICPILLIESEEDTGDISDYVLCERDILMAQGLKHPTVINDLALILSYYYEEITGDTDTLRDGIIKVKTAENSLFIHKRMLDNLKAEFGIDVREPRLIPTIKSLLSTHVPLNLGVVLNITTYESTCVIKGNFTNDNNTLISVGEEIFTPSGRGRVINDDDNSITLHMLEGEIKQEEALFINDVSSRDFVLTNAQKVGVKTEWAVKTTKPLKHWNLDLSAITGVQVLDVQVMTNNDITTAGAVNNIISIDFTTEKTGQIIFTTIKKEM